jgi:gluconolactonase
VRPSTPAVVEQIPARWERLDERFAEVGGESTVARIADGCRWTEGGVYVPAGRYFVWSDIPNDRMLRWDETSGVVSVFRSPSGYANGSTLDEQGRLISCQHGHRQVVRTEHDGRLTVLADSYRGKRLNSPNDVVVRSDRSIWFTDPTYGILSDYEGYQSEPEVGSQNVYRIHPDTGECVAVAEDFDQPNGLAFSRDESQLYVVDSGRGNLRVFDCAPDGTLSGGDVLADCTAGIFDGIRLDSAGRIWAAAGDGVHCLDPDGTLLGKLLLPEPVANVVFGGPRGNLLFACASTSVYLLMLKVTGAPGAHARRSKA